MGNSLTISRNDRRINDSILGETVKDILREDTAVFEKGKLTKINKERACCLGVSKKKGETPGINDFVTVKLPIARDDTDHYCKAKGLCMQSANYGLTFPNTDCGLDKGTGTGTCDRFMVNKCGKELYDKGCLIVTERKDKDGNIIKNEDGTPKFKRTWNTKNPNCFTKAGNLAFGSPDCTCVNSQTGYNLNNDPTNTLIGGPDFEDNNQNPYELIENAKLSIDTWIGFVKNIPNLSLSESSKILTNWLVTNYKILGIDEETIKNYITNVNFEMQIEGIKNYLDQQKKNP